jgi:hypothetical protein
MEAAPGLLASRLTLHSLRFENPLFQSRRNAGALRRLSATSVCYYFASRRGALYYTCFQKQNDYSQAALHKKSAFARLT